ncbi:hypothetical protein AAG897_01770, partial [Lacticaseibacillus rhamnosus]|uniref:hypothetical protein n=1 Tax=Lacticaseibacillus rhamnosus TaxID=47715 RepID=UPI0031F4AA01
AKHIKLTIKSSLNGQSQQPSSVLTNILDEKTRSLHATVDGSREVLEGVVISVAGRRHEPYVF